MIKVTELWMFTRISFVSVFIYCLLIKSVYNIIIVNLFGDVFLGFDIHGIENNIFVTYRMELLH